MSVLSALRRHALAAVAFAAVSAPAVALDVGASITVGQPGFYGRIDIGSFPQPALVFPQPVIVQPVPVRPAPIYMNVPPGHANNWSKHCARYGACSRPVYFVQNEWYERVYVTEHRKRHGGGKGGGKGGHHDGPHEGGKGKGKKND